MFLYCYIAAIHYQESQSHFVHFVPASGKSSLLQVVLVVARATVLEVISMTLARSIIEVGKGSGGASSSALSIAEKQLQERRWQRK